MNKLKDTDANQNYFQIKVEVMMMQVMFDFERAVIQSKNLACRIFPKDSHISDRLFANSYLFSFQKLRDSLLGK